MMDTIDSQVENTYQHRESTLQPWLDRVRPYLLPIGLFLLTIVLYANTFGHELLVGWDDFQYITGNPFLQNFNLQGLVDIYTNFHYGAYLPVTLTSYWVEFALWGADPAGYHIVNVIFQGFNGVLVYYFLRRLYGNWIVALIASLIFISHPLQVETVAWVSERKALLSMFFLLLGFLAHMQSLDKDASYPWLVFAWLLFVLSVTSKPITIGAGLLFIFYDYYWGKRTILEIIRRNAFYIVIGAIGAYFTVIAHDDFGALRPRHGGSVFGTAQIMSIVTWDYLASLVLPFDLNNFYGYDMDAIVRSFDIRTILAIGMVVGMAWIAWKEPLGKHISRFSILWIAVFFAPVSNIVPIAVLRADRYMYFPLVTISLLIAILFMRVWERRDQIEYRYGMAAGLAALIGIFSALTIQRNMVWQSEHTLWTDHLEEISYSQLGWLNRGYYHFVNGDYEEAQFNFEQLIALYPNADRGHRYLGLIAEVNQDYEEAIFHLSEALKLESDPESNARNEILRDSLGLSYFQLGYQQFNEGKFDSALNNYLEATNYLPQEPVLYNNIGFTYQQLENYEVAINYLRQALALNPAYTRAAVNLLNSAQATDNTNLAIEAFEIVVASSQDQQILSDACQKLDALGITDERCA